MCQNNWPTHSNNKMIIEVKHIVFYTRQNAYIKNDKVHFYECWRKSWWFILTHSCNRLVHAQKYTRRCGLFRWSETELNYPTGWYFFECGFETWSRLSERAILFNLIYTNRKFEDLYADRHCCEKSNFFPLQFLIPKL